LPRPSSATEAARGKIVKIREIIDTFELIQQVVEQDFISLIAARTRENT
jgi:hypothetical protein